MVMGGQNRPRLQNRHLRDKVRITQAKSINQRNDRSKHLPKDQTIIVLTYTRRVHLKKQPNLTFPYKIRRQDYTLNPA